PPRRTARPVDAGPPRTARAVGTHIARLAALLRTDAHGVRGTARLVPARLVIAADAAEDVARVGVVGHEALLAPRATAGWAARAPGPRGAAIEGGAMVALRATPRSTTRFPGVRRAAEPQSRIRTLPAGTTGPEEAVRIRPTARRTGLHARPTLR